MISVLSAYAISSLFFQEEIIFEREMEISSSYVENMFEMIEMEDMPQILELLRDYGIDAVILDHEHQPIRNEMNTEFVTEEMIAQIEPLGTSELISFPPGWRDTIRHIGMKITGIDDGYYLFLEIDITDELIGIRQLIVRVLLLVLLIGSLSIILISRHFVNSIHAITEASEQLATGDFSIRLETDRDDEIGRLMRSFNNLAKALGNMEEVNENFISDVSHEIQSPLTSIKGYTQALKDGLIPANDQQVYFDVIYQETDRLSRLSNNLLKIASLDAEEQLVKVEHYRLDEQIRRVILTTEPLWKIKKIDINLDLTKTYFYGDQDLMEQVWLNLVVNAIKYNVDQGEINISFYKDQDQLMTRINDTGIGIEKESLPYLFDRFYKVDKARSGNDGGTGLGLAIVKRIVQLHGGTIEVISEKDIGTTILIQLPVQ